MKRKGHLGDIVKLKEHLWDIVKRKEHLGDVVKRKGHLRVLEDGLMTSEDQNDTDWNFSYEDYGHRNA